MAANPYGLLSVRPGFKGLDPSLEEAAQSLGHKTSKVFWEITLPQLRPSIIILPALETRGL